MRALVYHGPGSKAWDEVPMPQIHDNTDAIVRVDCATICGSDLHILKGDVPEVTEGRILGHEAVGTVESVGAAVTTIAPRCCACRPTSKASTRRCCRSPSAVSLLGAQSWSTHSRKNSRGQ